VARRQLPRGAEDRQRGRNRVEGEVGLHGLEIDLAVEVRHPEQRLQLRREHQAPAGEAVDVDERLDPEPVARERQRPPARVPHRDREHAAELAREVGPVLLVEVDEDLGVR
jgi:hypothetical protein